MAEFYPSEIARLVLGYLKEAQCPNSWQIFLEECIDLQEHNRLYKEGKFCTTNVNGKSLHDILAEYCAFKNAANENNQNKCSTNTYQIYGIYKTPNKVNENSYAKFKINQKIQTQSVVSSNRSPSGRCNLFRSPTSRPTSRTPRRKLDCQATDLNFGSRAESLNESNIITTNASNDEQLSCATISTTQSNNSPKICDGNVKTLSQSKNSCKESESEHLSSPHSSQTSHGTPVRVVNASKSELSGICDKESFIHLTSDSIVHDTYDNVNSQISELGSEDQNSPRETLDSAIRQSSVQNQTIVYRSSEITTSTENISVSVLESCSTPHYEVEPPPYNRAPMTNSPRIVLSHDRSLIPSLTTPVKDRKSWTEEEWSPKRKGSIPRRRIISESPVSKHFHQPEPILAFDSVLENLFGPNDALFNEPLAQLLANNINKVKKTEFKELDYIQDGSLDDIVKKAVECIEEDPAFDSFLSSMGGNSKDCIDSNFCIEPSASTCTDIEKNISNVNETFENKITDKMEINTPNQEAPISSVNTSENDFQLHAIDYEETPLSANSASKHNFQLSAVKEHKTPLCATDASELNLNLNSANHQEAVQSSNNVNDETAKLNSEDSNKLQDIEKNILHSSDANADFDCNNIQKKSPNSQEMINSGNIDPIVITSKNDTAEDKANTSSLTEKLHKANDNLTSNILAVDDSNKDLCSAESSASGGTEMTNIINCTSISNNASTNNCINLKEPEAKQIDTNISENQQNTSVDSTQNSVQVDNSPSSTTSTTNQSGPTVVTSQLSNQPNTIVEAPFPDLTSFPLPSMIPDGTVKETKLKQIDSDNPESKLNTYVDNTQNSVQIDSTPRSTTSTTNQSGPIIITTQLSNQPNAIIEVPLPSLPAFLVPRLTPDGTLQSSLYRVIINTPIPFNAPSVGGICAPLPTIPTADVSSPLIAASSPSVPLLNVENLKGVDTPTQIVQNIVDTPHSRKPSKRKRSDVQGKSKKHSSKGPDQQDSASSTPSSSPTKSKRKSAQRKKKKLLCLFSSPSVESVKSRTKMTNNDVDSNIPVLSIPESPSNSKQCTAFELMSQITGRCEGKDKSPRLKTLFSDAAVLTNKNRVNSTYVRSLDFREDSTNKNQNHDLKASGKKKFQTSDLGESPVSCRRSARIERSKTKAEMLNSNVIELENVRQQKKKSPKSVSFNLSPSVNSGEQKSAVKEITPNTFESPLFNKALDVLNYSEDMQMFEEDIDASLEKPDSKENSDNTSELTSINIIPSNQTSATESKSQKTEVVGLADSDETDSNVKENLSLSESLQKKDKSVAVSQINSHQSAAEEIQSSIVPVKDADNCEKHEIKKDSIISKAPEESKNKIPLDINSEKRDNLPVSDSLTVSGNVVVETKNSHDTQIDLEDERNTKKEEINKSSSLLNESNAKSLETLLFGSDSEFTPEKKCGVYKSSQNHISSSFACTSVDTSSMKYSETGLETVKGESHDAKCKNISLNRLSSPISKQSVEVYNDIVLPSAASCNLINEETISLIASSPNQYSDVSFKASNNSECNNNKEKTYNFDDNNYKTKSHPKAVKGVNLVKCTKAVKQLTSGTSDALRNNVTGRLKKFVFNRKATKRSLENIVSLCKQTENSKASSNNTFKPLITPSRSPSISKMNTNKGIAKYFNRQSDTKISSESSCWTAANDPNKLQVIRGENNSNGKTDSNVLQSSSTSQQPLRNEKIFVVSAKSPVNCLAQNEKCVSPNVLHSKVSRISKPNVDSSVTLNDLKHCNEKDKKKIFHIKSIELTDSLESVNKKKKQVVISGSVESSKQVQDTESSVNTSITNNNCTAEIHVSTEKGSHLQSENSYSSLLCTTTSKETDTVPPPPKKRIKPIPVDSSSNESFTPFAPFLPSAKITKFASAVTSENQNKREPPVKCYSNSHKQGTSNRTEEKSNAAKNIPISNPVPSSDTVSYETCNLLNNRLKSSVSNSASLHSDSLSPNKQFATVIQIKSPLSKSQSKPSSPSPTFKSPFLWRSGKPKAMADFYKHAFPNKVSELPISPLSFSNSSGTAHDVFSAKRKLLTDSPIKSSEVLQNDAFNLQNCVFDKDSIQKEIESSEKQKKLKYDKTIERRKSDDESYKSLSRSYDKTHHAKGMEENSLNSLPYDTFEESEKSPLLNISRKRKSSDSCDSDTCSTVVDFDCEIATPVKSDDWLEKEVFSVKESPMTAKKTSSCSESDSSPEEEHLNIQPDFPLQLSNRNKDPEKSTMHSVSDHTSDINVVRKPSVVSNSNMETVIYKADSDKETKKDSAQTKLLSAKNTSKLKNYDQSIRQPIHSIEKKIKESTCIKKRRLSRPSLKIASFKSPNKKKCSNERQNLSFKQCSESSPQKDMDNKKASPNVIFGDNEYQMKSVKNSLRISSDKNAKLDRSKGKRKTRSNIQTSLKTFSKETVKSPSQTTPKKNIVPVVSKESIECIDQTTRDIVESDIGRSNEEGSELSIAIAACERELLNSQSDRSPQSPGYQANDGLSEHEKLNFDNKESETEKYQSPFKKLVAENPKFDILMNKLTNLGPEKLNIFLDSLLKDKE